MCMYLSLSVLSHSCTGLPMGLSRELLLGSLLSYLRAHPGDLKRHSQTDVRPPTQPRPHAPLAPCLVHTSP